MATIDTRAAQARAARAAGALYLLIMGTSIFGEVVVRGSLIVWGDAARTAENFVASERLVRVGIVTDLAYFSATVVLTWCLWVALRPVGSNLALLGAMFRLVEVGVTFTATLFTLTTLGLLSGADFLKTIDSSELHSLALVGIGAQGEGHSLSFLPAGLGSVVFAWLWLRSGYVPKLLAGWGVFANFLWSFAALVPILSPALGRYQMALMIPVAIYEVTIGFWLLIRGAKLEVSPGAS